MTWIMGFSGRRFKNFSNRFFLESKVRAKWPLAKAKKQKDVEKT